MALRSTAAEPRPIEPLTLTSADWWRRLLFTSTSVWSGARPRSVAGRMWSVPSVIDGRGKLSEGATVDSASASSVVPCRSSVAAGSTSTGASESRRVRVATRVPVTTTSSMFSSGRWRGGLILREGQRCGAASQRGRDGGAQQVGGIRTVSS